MLVLDLLAVFILLIDGVQLRLGLYLFAEIGQVRTVIQRVIGVEVRLGRHGQDRAGLDIHHDGAAAVFHRVGCDGLVQVPLHDLLHIHVQREHQIGAVLCGKGGGVLVCNGIAHCIFQGDGAAVHTGKGGLIGFFQSVGANALAVRKAQHRRSKGAVGVAPVKVCACRHRDAALAGAVIRVFVRLVELRNVFFHRQLHGIVHFGRQHCIGRVHIDKRIIYLLILLLILFRRGIHGIQIFTVAGKQTQRQLPAHLGADGRVRRADDIFFFFRSGLRIQSRAVLGVGPDIPYPVGGSQRNAGGIIDLAADGLDGDILQLLLGGLLPVSLAAHDLDAVQAVDHDSSGKQHRRHSHQAADAARSGVQPVF